MKLKIALFLFTTTFLTSCQGQTSHPVVQTLDVKSYAEKINNTENPQLIDVRTPQEFASEKINDAKNINWNGDDFVAQVKKLDKSKPVYVYCKVGGRSAQAANKLAELGFKEIYNLDGGIMKWNAAGMEKSSSDKLIGMSSDDYQKLINSNKKVVINFGAEWCAPCKKMKPYISRLQEELKGKVKIVRLDADENKSLINDLKIDGLPVIIIYENGKETWRNLGYLSEEDFLKKV
jgi:rhodanese-related sulfurtransferase